MKKKIEIYCENTDTKKLYPLGTSLNDIVADQQIELDYPILGAMVNNELEELSYEICNDIENYINIFYKLASILIILSLLVYLSFYSKKINNVQSN